MNPSLNSATTNGNLELEKVLRTMSSQQSGFPLGNIYFVVPAAHSNSTQFAKYYNKKYEDSSEFLQTTISAAYSAAVASRGDIIYVAPGYTETVTAVKTLSKIGVSIIGLGEGLNRPLITGNGTIDIFDLTAANQLLENIAFAAPSTDDQTSDVNVAAAGCVLRKLYSIGSTTAKNKTDIITVASGANDLIVEQCRAYNVTVDCVSWLSLEAAVARTVIRDNVVQGAFSTAALMDEAASTLGIIQRNIFKNTKAATAVVNFTNNSTGVMSHNFCSGRHTTIASNIVAGTGMDFHENYVVEEAALNGLYIPAQDAD